MTALHLGGLPELLIITGSEGFTDKHWFCKSILSLTGDSHLLSGSTSCRPFFPLRAFPVGPVGVMNVQVPRHDTSKGPGSRGPAAQSHRFHRHQIFRKTLKCLSDQTTCRFFIYFFLIHVFTATDMRAFCATV